MEVSYYLLEHADGHLPRRIFRHVETFEEAYFEMWAEGRWSGTDDRAIELLRLEGYDYRQVDEDEVVDLGAGI